MQHTLLLLLLAATADSANILGIFPYPYYSHQKLHASIIQALVDRGHSATIFMTVPQDIGNHPNVTQHHYEDSLKLHVDTTDMLMYKRSNMHWSRIIMQHELPAFLTSTQREMEHPEMQNLIHNSSDYKFDLIITECIFCPHLLLAEIYDCPVVMVAASEAHDTVHRMFGNDVNSFKYSDALFFPFQHGRLSPSQAVSSLGFRAFQELIFNPTFFAASGYLNWKYFGHLGIRTATTFPYKRLSLAMFNTNPAFGHVRALMPNSIQIGYVHVEPPKVLPESHLKSFLDNSQNGVIVMSLGSRAEPKQLGIENVRKFMAAFNATDMNVLWKLHDVDEELEVPHNVEIVNWMPLSDVLAHPNVKLLIYHGGLLTTYEAIDREVPMVVFPLAYDQAYNARLMTGKGIAKELDLNTFSAAQLIQSIKEVTLSRYRRNIKEMKRLAYDRPMSSKELVVWHVEHAIRNKIVYADKFGEMSFVESVLVEIFGYLLVFLVSARLLMRRKRKWMRKLEKISLKFPTAA